MVKVLVLYYSSYGHVEQMARAQAEGAQRVADAQVTVKRVPELVSRDFLDQTGPLWARHADRKQARGRNLDLTMICAARFDNPCKIVKDPPAPSGLGLSGARTRSMSNESMALALDARHRPIEISARRWSSSDAAWSGFPVECHVLGPRGRLNEFGIDYTLLGLCVKGRGTLRVDDGKSGQRVRSLPGRFTIPGSGFEQRPLPWTGTRRAPATPRGIVLSATQARRVRDYVYEHLGSDISLSELASQAGLSPHYFSLLFKRAFGVSPYRYVLSARIHRAKRLLGERKMAISEIALELGFADQSHFSKVFKTFVGSAPGQYRSLSEFQRHQLYPI